MSFDIAARQPIESFGAKQFGDPGEILGQHVTQAQEIGVGIHFQALGSILGAARLDLRNEARARGMGILPPGSPAIDRQKMIGPHRSFGSAIRNPALPIAILALK